ncbi:unnamed protein product [Prorocentrum cordatum]|uniref:EF-hand domain-containing protein n=1 Tax=Prorocentrum cordatum TaxID=2364126 RepID=A0ABN9PY50_9DINO|nr:unnamed protein product [Polarella glacialis]
MKFGAVVEVLKALGWPHAHDRDVRGMSAACSSPPSTSPAAASSPGQTSSGWTAGDPEAWEELRALLLSKYGHLLRAWRMVLDKDSSNKLSWTEFRDACKQIGFAGNTAGAWRHLDDDMSGYISMREYDREGAELLQSFKHWAESCFGSVTLCFKALDEDRSGSVTLTELKRACHRMNWKGDVRLLFQCLDADQERDAATGKKSIELAEICFLDEWNPEPAMEDVEEATTIPRSTTGNSRSSLKSPANRAGSPSLAALLHGGTARHRDSSGSPAASRPNTAPEPAAHRRRSGAPARPATVEVGARPASQGSRRPRVRRKLSEASIPLEIPAYLQRVGLGAAAAEAGPPQDARDLPRCATAPSGLLGRRARPPWDACVQSPTAGLRGRERSPGAALRLGGRRLCPADEAEKLARLLLLDVVPASSQSHQRDSHGDGARGQWQGHGQSSGAPWSGAEDHSWTGWQAPQPEHESTSAGTWSGGGAATPATEVSQGRSEQWHPGGWSATRSTWHEPDRKSGEQQWASSRSTWTPASTWESYEDRAWEDEYHGGGDWSSGWRWSDSYQDSKWEPNKRYSGYDGDRSSTNTGKDFADPEKWRGWGDYRMWRRTVLRWRTLTDVPSHKQADRLFRSLDQDLQRKLEDLDDDMLCSSWGFAAIIKRLDLMSGERHGDERRKVARECLLDHSRKQGENLTEYCARVDTAFDRVATQGLPLPDAWKLMFLEEGVSLDERSAQVVKVLMKDQKDYKSALSAIREMDISHREHLKARRTYATVPTYQVDHDDESLLDYSDVSSMNSDGEAEVWAILESADVGEDDAPAALAAINQERRKTWKQNRDLKRQLKTDRKFHDRSGQSRGSDGREKVRRPGHRAADGAEEPPSACMLNCPGATVVDTAAGQGLVGEQALQQIEGQLRLQDRSIKGSGVERHLRLRAEQHVYFGTRQGFELQVETFQNQGRVDSAGLEVADVGHDASLNFIHLPRSTWERPRTMTDRMQSQTDSAWVYGATGTDVPENLNKGEKGWACLAGWAPYWSARLAEGFGGMCRAKRFWPTNLPKPLRRLSEMYGTCWHPPTLVSYGANSWGKWFVCGARTMRVGYWELRPTKGTVKEEKMCLCRKKDAACTLRGQGWAQGATADPQWQALACVPKPPPGAERAPLPLHPGMMAGGLASGSFLAARQPGYQRAAEDAAKVTEALQKDQEMREYQAKTERDVKSMVESQFQEASRMIRAMAQGSPSSKADQAKVAAAAVDSSPALGGHPTHGPPVEQKTDAVTPRSPDRLFTADEMPIGSTGALTTEASLSLPGTDLAAPPTAAVGPHGKGNNKGKSTPSRRQEHGDPWTPGPEEKGAEKRRREHHEWKEAGWKTYHNGRWT